MFPSQAQGFRCPQGEEGRRTAPLDKLALLLSQFLLLLGILFADVLRRATRGGAPRSTTVERAWDDTQTWARLRETMSVTGTGLWPARSQKLISA
jgi:hypothetical protein